MNEFKTLLAEILQFRDEREWAQFHTLKNLIAALSVEVAELQEVLLWKTDSQTQELLENPEKHIALRREFADVLIYALLFAEAAGIDPVSAVRDKIAENALKYPVDKSRGSATKYTDFK